MQLRKSVAKLLCAAIAMALFVVMTVVFVINKETKITAHAGFFNLGDAVNLNDTSIGNFTGLHFIPNSNYFYLNPEHHRNAEGESWLGECSTVAVQMLLGYHNYYSDRRLIPGSAEGKQFLSANYGDMAYHPKINTARDEGLGIAEIGTEDAVFDEILDRTFGGSLLNQVLPFVKNGAMSFLEDYSQTDAQISMEFDLFDSSEVNAEINAGRPVVLGMSGVLDGEKSMHVVVAYGYATYNGEFGYIVHWGHFGDKTQIWAPVNLFEYQITMNVAHTHSMLDTGESYDFSYKIYECSICGYTEPISYYTTDATGSIITGTNFTLNGQIKIPDVMYGHEITAIGNAAFANQDCITSVTISGSITSIGANAFENCSSVEEMNITSSGQLTSIGNSAFRGCSSLFGIWIPEGVTSIGANTFENCTGLSVFWGGTSLTDIGNSAFRNCSSLSGVNLYRTITVIGYNAFENCVSLDLNKLPTSLERIENAAFAGCTGLENMNLPIGLEHIGYDAFNSCSGLQTVLIPDTVTSIGGNAFANCSYLTVYTNCQSVPSGWVSNWNPSGRPVICGCNLETENNYVLSITNAGINLLNENAPNGINDPYRNGYTFDGWYTSSDFSGTGHSLLSEVPNGELYAKWTAEDTCVAEGSLITLADGTQKAVEELTGNEMLLVWDLFNGTFSAAPILFIDSDPMRAYEVITLTFADGTEVKVIDEHGFWNVDLNEYVFLRADAAKYIGDKFNKQIVDANGNMTYTAVELVSVSIATEYTTAWSPVTYGHLCYYVNGMLSMPGATTGLINIFEVDPDTMKIDEEAYAEDIAEYGVYTYEEFTEEIAEVPETIFNAFGGAYLKVAIGKGILTEDMILELISRYSEFFD